MISAYREDLLFTIQEDEASDWRSLFDTSLGSPEDFRESGEEQPVRPPRDQVKLHSVVVLF